MQNIRIRHALPLATLLVAVPALAQYQSPKQPAAAPAQYPGAAQPQRPAVAQAQPPVAGESWQAESWAAEARVVSTVPIRESRRVPREECWTETVPSPPDQSGQSGSRSTGTIVGEIAGGLLDRHLGGGSAEKAAPEVVQRNERGEQVVERCRQVTETAERIVGYDVVYRFQGRELSTRLPYDPGSTLPVQVTVAPAR